jgi:arsenate reductase-like glutaredoxin family protein
MAYILLDESGNLGFDFTKKGTTDYFLITFLFCEHKRPIEKCVKKTYATLRKQHKKQGKILHAYAENRITRHRLLKCLSNKECSVLVIYLNKKKVYTKLQEEKAVLYNYVTNILLDRIFTKRLIPFDQEVVLIASKRETNVFLNENFKNYLKNQALNTHKVKLHIEIKTPFEDKALQAVDFISWAIFRKYEYKDGSYYEMIKEKIAEENPLFP